MQCLEQLRDYWLLKNDYFASKQFNLEGKTTVPVRQSYDA
jgi:hypothetical protein